MPTLHVANNRTAWMQGGLDTYTAQQRASSGCSAQRVLWFARDHDVLVLPWAPRPDYLGHITALTGTDPDTLDVLVAPPDETGSDMLTPARLADPALRDEVVALVERRRREHPDRAIEAITAMSMDPSVVRLVDGAGLTDLLPGAAFSRQGGESFLNSKAWFRAAAAGIGVPIAAGTVVRDQAAAARAIEDLLGPDRPVLVKKEFQAGGMGNEVLTRGAAVPTSGAAHTEDLPGRAEVGDYLARRWAWLSDHGAAAVTVERWYPDSRALYVEYQVDDAGVELIGHGELVHEQINVGATGPAEEVPGAAHDQVLRHGRALAELARTVGYRGVLGPDAILTGTGEVLFTEVNGRVTGCTHLHTGVAARAVGPRLAGQRVYAERDTTGVPDLDTALRRIATAGLTFDPDSATGMIVTCDLTPAGGPIMLCVIAADHHDARRAWERFHATADSA